MHYTFDLWMQRKYPQCRFCRYADDAVVHCKSQEQAGEVMQDIASRLAECGLTMHPEKSQIVYCKDSNRTENYPHVHFTFLGFAFRPRKALSKTHRLFTSFLPGASSDAMKKMRQAVRGVETESADTCGTRCTGQAIQPHHPRVVELLWGVLSNNHAPYLPAHRPCARTMGPTQVQDPIGTAACQCAVVAQDEER